MRNALAIFALCLFGLLAAGCAAQDDVLPRRPHNTSLQLEKTSPASMNPEVLTSGDNLPKGTASGPADLAAGKAHPISMPPARRAERQITIALQPVHFVTNREVHAARGAELPQMTAVRSTNLTYGMALVTIPIKKHRIGQVERPATRFFGLVSEREDESKHFRLRTAEILTREQFIVRLRSPDSILLFIHGYNVSFNEATFRAAQIAFDANFQGPVMLFSWPSAAETIKYDYDVQSALFSGGHLFTVLKMLKDDVRPNKLFVVAHSLGNQVLVDALQQAALSNVKLAISELVLAAPDVDKDVFLSKAAQIKAVAENVTIYASSADRALLLSKSKAQGPRMGFISKLGPNLAPDMETIDVTAVGNDMFGLNHGTYSNSRAVLDDLGRLLIDGKHPPHLRSPTLRRMPNAESTKYWFYPR